MADGKESTYQRAPRVSQAQMDRPRRDQANAVQDLGRIEGDGEWPATEQNRRLREWDAQTWPKVEGRRNDFQRSFLAPAYDGGVRFNPAMKLDPSQVEYAPTGVSQAGGAPLRSAPPGFSPYTGQNDDHFATYAGEDAPVPFYLLHPDGTHSGPHYDKPTPYKGPPGLESIGKPTPYKGPPGLASKPKPVVAHQTMKPEPKPVTKAPPKVKQPPAPRSGPNRQA